MIERSAILVTNETATAEKPARAEALFQKITCNLQGSLAREETLEGRAHVAVPVVLLVEGVHAGSNGPILYNGSDLTKAPDTWDYVPVVLNHPEKDGKGASACTPEMIEKHRVGVLFRSGSDSVTTNGKSLPRLKSEAWLDVEHTKKKAPGILDRIKKGEVIEVSTGLFLENEATSGVWNGESYASVARNFRPDHLAILPNSKGACSVSDGAGLNRNEATKPTTNAKSHDEIRSALYGQLDKKFPSTGVSGKLAYMNAVYDGYCVYEAPDGKTYAQPYVLDDDSNVQFDGEPTQVVKTVQYQDAKGNVVGNAAETIDGEIIGHGEIGPRAHSTTDALFAARARLELPTLNAAATKTEDGKTFSASAYAYAPDTALPSTWKLRLVDAPDDAKPSVKLTADAAAALGAKGWRGQKVQIPAKDLAAVKAKVLAAWKRARKGTSEATAEPPVHLTTNAAETAKEKPVTKIEMIAALVTNAKSGWTDEDKPALEAMSEKRLAALVANAEKPAEEPKPETKPAAPAPQASAPAPTPAPATNAAPALSAEDQQVLEYGRHMIAQRRAELVSTITANKENKFSAAELTGMHPETLAKLAALARTPVVANAKPANPAPLFFGGLDAHVSAPAAVTEKPLTRPVVNWREQAKK